MAKGQSTFQQLGRIDGRKYYRVKGVDGIVSQHINEKMGDRVKNGAEYANTRLNNAEFGGAGSTAGSITRALTQKWRYLLVPFATGKIAKDVRAIMMQDTTGKWGQRGLTGTSWQAALAEKISAYSKNSVEDYTGLNIGAQFDSSTGLELNVDCTALLHNEKLEALGCTGIRIIGLDGVVNASVYDSASGKYAPASSDFVTSAAVDFDFGADDSVVELKRAEIKVTAQSANLLYGGIAVILPYKEVNGQKYIMQEHCSFKFVAA